MINPGEHYATRVVEYLDKGNLFSSEELSLIEDYLCKNAGDEVLGQLSYRDLSDMTESSIISNLYADLLDKGKEEEAKRLGELLFAIGEASGHKMFSKVMYLLRQRVKVILEPAKKAAIYASLMGDNQNCIKKQDFEDLIGIAGHKLEHLRKALDYRTGKSTNGILVLLTAYFYAKYPKIKEGMVLEGEDAVLMKQYEDMVIENLPNIYEVHLPKQDGDRLKAAVAQVQTPVMDEDILKLVKGYKSIHSFWHRMLVGIAFANYGLSYKLKNVVDICFAVNWGTALDYVERMDLRKDLMGDLGGCFDRVFHVKSKDYIQWAARNRKVSILKKQSVENQKTYLECMDEADYPTYNIMAAILEETAPDLVKGRLGGEGFRQQSKLIEAFARNASCQLRPAANDIKKYLSFQGGIEHVYACKDMLKTCYYWANSAVGMLKTYQKNYGHDVFSNRCDTLLLASNGYSFQRDFVTWENKVDEEEVKRVFAVADAEGLNLATQLEGYLCIIDHIYNPAWTEAFTNVMKNIFKGYLSAKSEETLSAFQEAESIGRSFGLSVMADNADDYKETILSFAKESTKSVKEALLGILYAKKDWEEDIISLLSSKKAAERDVAIRILAKWKEEAQWQTSKEGEASDREGTVSQEEGVAKYTQILSQALEAEKNAKIRKLLESVLRKGVGTADGGRIVTQDELVKEIHVGNKKRSLAWAYETPFSKVHRKNGVEAEEEYLQAIFLCYYTMSPCGVSKSAEFLARDLDEKEFAVYANELFDKWMEAGAEAKKRWVLYAAAIHGGSHIVKKLQHQIQEWPKASRGAIASEAVQALALSPEPQGLLIVDGISRKFKFKQVKTAAAAALEFAASQLGITTEELADRIVPNLGFDENMQRIFDYGERKFTVSITPALEIEVFDESGKKLKNLPAPGKKDDEAKATAAYDEFKQMKKQMKTTVSSQKMRLEMALSTERQWSVQAWKDLFVKNPIMHQFAIGLIWGVYQDRKLVSSFRYMEDGSFNTEDEEEFFLPEEAGVQLPKEPQSPDQASAANQTNAIDKANAIGQAYTIGLIHPIELSEESLETWKGQLEDYEIVQPIEQLDRQVYYRTEEEGEQITLERFGGMIVNDLSLIGKLTTQGWYRGSVEDGGSVHTYYREDKELGLGAVLYFSGSYVGGINENVTVYEIRFFNAGRLSTWSYDKDVDNKSCLLSKVPERYFSEIVLQVAKATATSTEKNVNWKKDR